VENRLKIKQKAVLMLKGQIKGNGIFGKSNESYSHSHSPHQQGNITAFLLSHKYFCVCNNLANNSVHEYSLRLERK
jgi:hypothetical protein